MSVALCSNGLSVRHVTAAAGLSAAGIPEYNPGDAAPGPGMGTPGYAVGR